MSGTQSTFTPYDPRNAAGRGWCTLAKGFPDEQVLWFWNLGYKEARRRRLNSLIQTSSDAHIIVNVTKAAVDAWNERAERVERIAKAIWALGSYPAVRTYDDLPDKSKVTVRVYALAAYMEAIR